METIQLADHGRAAPALAYVTASLAAGMALAAAATVAARRRRYR